VCGQELSNFRSVADFKGVGWNSSEQCFHKQHDVYGVLELAILFGNLALSYCPEIFKRVRKIAKSDC
jgi:hypothetical protein